MIYVLVIYYIILFFVLFFFVYIKVNGLCNFFIFCFFGYIFGLKCFIVFLFGIGSFLFVGVFVYIMFFGKLFKSLVCLIKNVWILVICFFRLLLLLSWDK